MGLNARLVLATDEATAADSISDGRRENDARRLRRRRRRRTLAPDAKPAWETEHRRPARFPPRVSSFATPGPSSRDRFVDALLPATYGHDDSLASEPAGMNAVVADARGDLPRRLERLERFAPRAGASAFAESVFSAAPPDAWAAEWMSGPDPRDTAEGEGEETRPPPRPRPRSSPSPRRWRGRSAFRPRGRRGAGDERRGRIRNIRQVERRSRRSRRRRGARAGRARVGRRGGFRAGGAHAAPGDARRRNRRRRRGPEDAVASRG